MKILVYDDNPVFGGHQIMACHGVEALAANPTFEVACMLNPANQMLAQKLADVQTLEADPQKFHSLEPDLVLCIQGDIAQSSKGLLAAKRADIKCVSYIATPHRMADMGAKLGTLRDHKNQPLFNIPDRFITISESMEEIIRERGCTKPITIVPNGILLPPTARLTPRASRVTLGLIGRIEFKQKQQDFMVQTFLNNPEFSESHLLIIGDGPDAEKLNELIRGKDNITLLPWQNDMEPLYEQIDMLVIPSRYEGVPLVMLEALARGIPTLGTACDGMKDLLPETWTFEPENAQALVDTFSTVRRIGPNEISALQQKIRSKHSLEAFKQAFVKAVSET